jgi:uncharacterized protein (UPF0248 family)
MQGVMTVPKENVGQMKFYQEDVLKEASSRKLRMYDLEKALSLGNLYRQKVTIVYALRNGDLQQVQTTVWSVGEQYVILKGGITIPVHSILKVEF